MRMIIGLAAACCLTACDKAPIKATESSAIAAPSPAPSAPRPSRVEYKGTVLGQKPDPSIGAGSPECEKVFKQGRGTCTVFGTYAQSLMKQGTIDVRNGVLYEVFIQIDPASFDSIAGALEEKYGKPEINKTTDVSNAMGAHFTDRTMQWFAEDGGHIYAQKYVSDITRGVVSLSSPQSHKAMMDRIKSQGPKSADL